MVDSYRRRKREMSCLCLRRGKNRLREMWYLCRPTTSIDLGPFRTLMRSFQLQKDRYPTPLVGQQVAWQQPTFDIQVPMCKCKEDSISYRINVVYPTGRTAMRPASTTYDECFQPHGSPLRTLRTIGRGDKKVPYFNTY